MPEIRSLDEAIDSQKKIIDKAKKPGFLTSEFWASCVGQPLIAVLGALKLLDSGSPVAAVIIGCVGLAGPIIYTFAREGLKKAMAVAASTLVEQMSKKGDAER